MSTAAALVIFISERRGLRLGIEGGERLRASLAEGAAREDSLLRTHGPANKWPDSAARGPAGPRVRGCHGEFSMMSTRRADENPRSSAWSRR